MLKTVLKYLNAYIDTNEEVLESESLAEVMAAKTYISTLLDTTLGIRTDILEKENEKLKKQVNRLRTLLFAAMKEKQNGDTEVKKSEFLAIYNEAMKDLGADECELYGNDVTVHWHGIYCNCSDGATAWNNIVSNIESVIDEEGDD